MMARCLTPPGQILLLDGGELGARSPKPRQKRGSARSIGPVKRCAVVLRGEQRCAWCAVALVGKDATTIDHVDGVHRNNAPSNMVPSCAGCNSSRAWGERHFAYRLRRLGVALEDAWARVRAQLAAPLDLDAGRELAEQWYPGRREREQEARERWNARHGRVNAGHRGGERR